MVHGPHNQAFYKYLDELKHEMESLMVRGLVGEEGVKFSGAGEGQRLGGSSVGVQIRVAAVLAAKRREQYHSLLGGETSRRLGSLSSKKDSKEALDSQMLRRKVLEAAERRRIDNEHCRNVLREGASHEVLGIESSDEEDGVAARQQRVPAPRHPTVPDIIDLVGEEEEEKSDGVQERKRKRGDVIDLT
ncbi:hypothetical protein P3T76_003164 [Phytophthora citrophthora]|uniref:WLM domain-containing protein n=1 Tax=Phytophthora citrophthora TaxID=4793 RepID=A0AAD9LRP7_9STRA|nr:hypothetical protein P3T76_003164 [Phytophthora citrophthora]